MKCECQEINVNCPECAIKQNRRDDLPYEMYTRKDGFIGFRPIFDEDDYEPKQLSV